MVDVKVKLILNTVRHAKAKNPSVLYKTYGNVCLSDF